MTCTAPGTADHATIVGVGWLSDLRAKAYAEHPPWVERYVEGGAGDELSLADAPLSWDRIRLRPRVLVDVADLLAAGRHGLTTSVLGTRVSSPLLVAPSALQRAVHADGEVATAKGAAAAGSLFCMSSRSGRTVEQIAATGARWWMQAYVLRDREATESYLRRAAAAGAGAVVLTGDTPAVPRRATQPVGAGSGDGTRVPAEWVRANLPDREYRPDDLLQAPDLSEHTIGWIAEITGLPVVVKGVLRADDARRCVNAGAAAVIVSNHGARQLDGAINPCDAIAEVADALSGTDAEVYADGGIRRGTHVLRALALGARAVLIGRPVLWGLGAAGAAGVRDVLVTLADELADAMVLAGAPSLREVTRDLIYQRGKYGIDPGFGSF